MIISASRRTDIPAFYSKWFMNRIYEEKVVAYNPYNKCGYEVSLNPKNVDAIVFWSKNYGPLIPKLDELKGKYNLYFLFTITGLKDILEDNVISPEQAIDQLKYISKSFSTKHIQWRFDPIVLTNKTPREFYIDKFYQLAKELKGYTRRCYISFANIYKKNEKNFKLLEKKRGIHLLDSDEKNMKDLANEIAVIGEGFGIEILSCCNDFLVGDKISKASCIDINILDELFSIDIKSKLSPTRPQCACYKSIDIGVYNTCPHGCWYCYANYDKETAIKNFQQHDPNSDFLLNRKIKLIKELTEDDKEIETQLRLFK